MSHTPGTETPSIQIIRSAINDAIKNGRSFHDYWYYTMTPQDQALFNSFRVFETRADAAYKHELERRDRLGAERSIAAEAYWKEKQGDEYGSY